MLTALASCATALAIAPVLPHTPLALSATTPAAMWTSSFPPRRGVYADDGSWSARRAASRTAGPPPGGLVPQMVAPDVTHSGTIDVDLVLDVAVIHDRDAQDFAFLETALQSIGAVPSASASWKWVVEVDGVPVRVTS